jgi:hypothetical protein
LKRLAILITLTVTGLVACGGPDNAYQHICDFADGAVRYKAQQLLNGELTQSEYDSEMTAALERYSMGDC